MAALRARPPGRYGIDAPYMLALPVGILLVNVAGGLLTHRVGPWIGAAAMASCVAIGLHTSRRGKFVTWARLLDELGLAGSERVLDVGCGRGAVTIMVAQRLSRGTVVGVDRWETRDQSGNAPGVPRQNAEAAAVANRVRIVTGDFRELPFAAASFDLVVSSLAIHNVSDRVARDRAIDEAMRVLRPDGHLVIVDIFATSHYRSRLEALGAREIVTRRLGWRMWWSGPWVPSALVSARQPTASTPR